MLRALTPQSLAARVFWMILGVCILVEVLAVLPEMGKARQNWLWERMRQAKLVAIAIRSEASPISPQMQDTMLRLSRTVAITLSGGGAEISLRPQRMPALPAAAIQLDEESLPASIWRAATAILNLAAPYARIDASDAPPSGQTIEIVISRRLMGSRLRFEVARAAALGGILALVTASLTFVALNRLLVRPMQVITQSIAGFRRNPSHVGLSGLKWLAGRREDEISRAARELVAMQEELRAALWRNARLAALGTAVARVSHDLRNILTSALLAADRVHRNGDALVKQAANTLIPAMERAVEMVSRTVDFAQEGPPSLNVFPVVVHELVNEVADMLRATDGSIAIENRISESLVLSLDRNQIYRVLVNLLRNAAEAGASRITLGLEGDHGMAVLVIADNGPGLPGKVVGNLFRPFTGTSRNGGAGLGLAIARDLIRAHGGELILRHTGPNGAIFTMSLPAELPEETPVA